MDCTHHRLTLITHPDLAPRLSSPWHGGAQTPFLGTEDIFILCTTRNPKVETRSFAQGCIKPSGFCSPLISLQGFCFPENRHLWIALIAEHPWDH